MRILLVNDDGIESKGLNALFAVFSKKHEVMVVAPDSERSGASHSVLSLFGIECNKLHNDKEIYSCSGTPADCVKLAIMHLFKDNLPDIIVSGINNGRNLGSDILYSGTVAAASEGAYLGIRSIAVSTDQNSSQDELVLVAEYVDSLLEKIANLDLPLTTIININYPFKNTVKGSKIASIGYSQYTDVYHKISDRIIRLIGQPAIPDDETNTDEYWFNQGYITISPIKIDRSDYESIEKLQRSLL